MNNQNYKQGKRDGFTSGRKTGIWLSYNYIFPISINALNKDLARTAVGTLRLAPRYSSLSHEQLKQVLRDAGYNKVIFKEQNGELRVIPRA